MKVTYEIDVDDRLIGHDLGWEEFAIANDAPDLAHPDASTSLWESIADETTRLLWRELIDHVRRTGTPLDIKYRCDAPHARRWFTARLTPHPDRRVRFVATLEREEQRTPVVDETITVDPDRFPRMCSWCARFACDDADDAPNDIWCEIDEAAGRQGWLEHRRAPSVTYTVCPSCLEQQLAELEAIGGA